ncbi:hypothetical protein CLV84_0327 [Neolewinella xylanilytica]|uniref:Uncharacterized protein n=1 Tax=Neolewinella xylanilytica TaxID=1514080 RepID=A0A2S6I7D4_9BACT|nr:hypothetical protein CLV84_0327 [Neolewinella xylanilytica]
MSIQFFTACYMGVEAQVNRYQETVYPSLTEGLRSLA